MDGLDDRSIDLEGARQAQGDVLIEPAHAHVVALPEPSGEPLLRTVSSA